MEVNNDLYFLSGNDDSSGRHSRQPQPWIIEKLVDLLIKSAEIKSKSSDEEEGPCLRQVLKNELLDLVEGEYFKQSLLESF